MVTAAAAQMSGRQSHTSGASAVRNTRTKAAKAATFVPAAMNPVTLVGAP